jgi:hypothetical protein
MHHEMQELGDLCLELVRLGPVGSGCFLCCLGHDVLANPGEIGKPYGLAGAQVKGTKKRPDSHRVHDGAQSTDQRCGIVSLDGISSATAMGARLT